MNLQTRPTAVARILFAAALLCFAPIIAMASAQAATRFTFTLNAPYVTTAGAYNSKGQLVRTIWRRVPFAAGVHTGTWDDLDDYGKPAPAGTYTIKVLFHNATAVWDGTVGNTSSSFVGPHVWRGFDPVYNIAVSGTNAYVAFGYNEGQTGEGRFSTGSPQSVDYIGKADSATCFQYVATDGVRAYYATASGGYGDKSSEYTFTLAFNVADNSQYTFPAGQGVSFNNGRNWYPSCIDVDHDTAAVESGINQPTGIAVQQSGNILAVAHGPRNLIRLFDKVTGAPLANSGISVSSPQALAFAPNGDLWVLTGTQRQVPGKSQYIATGQSVERFDGATLGATNEPSGTISGLSQPLNITVDPSTGNVLVAYGGTSQQVKAFNGKGALQWTYGVPGGYITNGPAVVNDKFQFRNTVNWVGPYAALAADPDGSFWVGDTGTCRLIHISSKRTYIENIEYTPLSYNCACDPTDPTHVYGGDFLEFLVDYGKPLSPNNRSWKLINNWAAGLPDDSQLFTGGQQGPGHVVTLSNGHIYAMMNSKNTGRHIVELTRAGIRDTGIEVAGNESLAADGSIRFDTPNDKTQTFYKLPLLGFDRLGDPRWPGPGNGPGYNGEAGFNPAPYVIATTPYTAGTDPTPGGGDGTPANIPITTSGVVVCYDSSLNPGMHLGGVSLDTSGNIDSWLWRSMPSVTHDVPPDGLGSYDIGDGVNYGGNLAMSVGRSIIVGYNGEFWAQNEMSQWMYFYDDGLFVTQFGTSGWDRIKSGSPIGNRYTPTPGFAGNAYSPVLVTTDRGVYLWHNDESDHGGLVRWHILGTNTIQEASGSGDLDGAITLTAPAPAFPTGLSALAGNSFVKLTWNAAAGADSYNVEYSTVDGGPYNVIQGTTRTSYSVTGLKNDGVYYFAVTAVSKGVVGPASNQVQASPHPTGQ